MDDQNKPDLKIDAASYTHLKEIAAWTRFLAITGIVFSIMLALVGLSGNAMLGTMPAASGGMSMISPGVLSVVYEIAAAIGFFLSIFLFRFADKMKTALANSDQASMNSSFQNLKFVFRFQGIIVIVYLTMIVLGLIAQAFMR